MNGLRFAGMGPDGMAISSNGHLFAALPGAGALGCYSVKTGQEVRKVSAAI